MKRRENHTDRAWALVGLLLGAAAIGFAPIFVRVSELGPTTTAFYRCLLALPVLAAWLWLGGRGANEARLDRREALRLALAGLFFAGDLGVWHFSIHYTTVANATLLTNLAPIFVTLGGFVLFKDRVTRLFLGGMALALLGAGMLMGDSLSVSDRQLTGDVLGVITALFYASYILAVGRLRARLATRVIMFWSTLATTVFLLPVALLSGEALVAETWQGWAYLAGLAITAQVLGQGLIAYALAHLPASFSAVSLLFQPVVAAVAAWVLFAEALGALQGAGAAVILLGVALARQGSIKRSVAQNDTDLQNGA